MISINFSKGSLFCWLQIIQLNYSEALKVSSAIYRQSLPDSSSGTVVAALRMVHFQTTRRLHLSFFSYLVLLTFLTDLFSIVNQFCIMFVYYLQTTSLLFHQTILSCFCGQHWCAHETSFAFLILFLAPPSSLELLPPPLLPLSTSPTVWKENCELS